MHRTISAAAIKLVSAIILLGLLVGCAIIPPERGEPEYAPALPSDPLPSEHSNGSIYQSGHDIALFEDIRAKRVGDILTVLLVEETDAKKSATTSTSRDTDVTIPNPTLFGGNVSLNGRSILQNTLTSEHKFDGTGDSAQSNKLDGNITVSVVRVLANGNLLVQGEKWISINQGDEYIRLKGIVRPVDIRPDNTVLSTQIGNTLIAYGGAGSLARSNRKGWLAEFFTSILWPL
ncbi:MAG: flagellar basal body L-ring protein FlgH [Gammaproteobacteria bacterium]|nr:flagellar basal body L-ring protein FlgH [Gammaproteobacteria bacterium]